VKECLFVFGNHLIKLANESTCKLIKYSTIPLTYAALSKIVEIMNTYTTMRWVVNFFNAQFQRQYSAICQRSTTLLLFINANISVGSYTVPAGYYFELFWLHTVNILHEESNLQCSSCINSHAVNVCFISVTDMKPASNLSELLSRAVNSILSVSNKPINVSKSTKQRGPIVSAVRSVCASLFFGSHA